MRMGISWVLLALPILVVADASVPAFKRTWRVVSCDSLQVGDGLPEDVIDENPKTFWHTEWKARSPGHPHEIVVDMRKPAELSGFVYTPRQVVGGAAANGRIDRYEFMVSADGSNWIQAIRGRFAEGGAVQTNRFARPVTGRYFKLVSWSAFGLQPWACVAELDVLLTDASAAQFRAGQ